MSSISVLILTLNEEVNLQDCLDSCAWSDDVVVFDSFSTDRTTEIAARNPVRLVQRRFDNYASQRNAALTQVPFKHPWVLMVDADERTPADLVAEMQEAIQHAGENLVLFRMRRKDLFFGRWLRRSSGYPTWFGRLMRQGRVSIEREINEEYVPHGEVAYLKAHLLHHPFNRGIAYWYERHNRYSSLEAVEKMKARAAHLSLDQLLSADPVSRQRTLKRLAYRLPMRPVVTFLYLYVIRLGFLDGYAGLCFCRMRASYELMIDLKVWELERRVPAG